MRSLLLMCLILVVDLVTADTYPRNESIDIKHYAFRLHLNDTTDIIAGEATVQLRIVKPISDFELDLVNQNAQKMGMRVEGVWMDGKEIQFSHQNNRLKIVLPTEVGINQHISVTIRYNGIPADGLIISTNMYGDRTFFGDNWPDRARNWLPCIDHPYDKARVDFIVTAPHHYTVVGNGVKEEESFLNPKQKLTHWHEEVDLPTKVMVIGVARFAIRYEANVDNISVESWVFPQNRDEGFRDYAPATRILEFFNNHIGPYSYKKLANVQSTTIYGGMENASNIFYYEKSVTGKGGIDNLIAHEIAHQWFGNSASEKDWHHVWLSEGFATYFAHVYNEFTYGKARLAEGLANDRQSVVAYCRKSPAPIINTATTDYKQLLTAHVYARASWVLHMLRREIGDEAFWKGIREYYRTYQNSNAMTADLQVIMERVSDKDLELFFRQWLNRAPLPALKMSWSYDQKRKTVRVTVDQAQKDELFNLPLELAIEYGTTGNGKRTEKVRISQKTTTFGFKSESKPVKIVLDPGINLLFEDLSKN